MEETLRSAHTGVGLVRNGMTTGAAACAVLLLVPWGGGGWCGGPGPASAQSDSSWAWPDSARTAPADSLSAFDALPSRLFGGDSVSVDPFIPVWKSFMNADDADVGMGSEMLISGMPGSDWFTKSVLRIEKKHYRGRDMMDLNQHLLNNAMKERRGLYRVTMNLGETYTKKKTLGLARYGKDLIYDTKNINMEAAYTKPILGARSSQLAVQGDVRGGTQDFKYDKAIGGGLSGAVTYGIGGLLRIKAG
ncbi:MAG TPA: hypothetical protein ENO08_08450, partial [Candidatus Eisenbacteria bacterium]|nr:hypothetical protein [Candidatus Eisenbacteria bacterium]